MSWVIEYDIHSEKVTAEDFKVAKYSSGLAGDSDTAVAAARSQQFEMAKVLALSLMLSGAVGDAPFKVVLSGHSNPEHKPLPGWANDCVTISVTQMDKPQ